jgi:hypothetical protein
VMAKQSRIDTDSIQWMMQVIADARNAMLHSAAALNQQSSPQASLQPQWPSKPVMSAMPYVAAPSLEPTFNFPTVVRHRRRGGGDIENVATAIGVLLMCGLLIFGVGCFIRKWFDEMPKKTDGFAATNELPVRQKPPSVAGGSGSPTPPGSDVTRDNTVTPKPKRVLSQSGKVAAARETLSRALTMAQQGSFDEAHTLAGRAATGMPDGANALQLMVEYARQYPDLADTARLALNGSDEIDLGQRYGKGQFVQQDAKEIVFFMKGAHKPLSTHEFNGLPGVRFRVARDFLERRQDLPANDLILGSYQYLLRLNRAGLEDLDGSQHEAETRFRRAANAGDPTVAEHARLMLTLLNANLRK